MAEDVFGIVGTVQGEAFRVEAVVAEGGFGVVYRAYHAAFRSNVALKCLKVPGTLGVEDQAAFLEKFREEAEVLFRLSSAIPSVVRPLHVGTLADQHGRFVPYLALEWLEGRTLDEFITARVMAGEPPLDARSAVKLLTPVADALCRAHHFLTPEGIVSILHRDLKPENVFLAKVHGREVVKVLDFGLAKVKSAATQLVGHKSAYESPISAFTPAYGAPEQWLPKQFGQTGPWTDVWGLAITLVELLAGHSPLEGDHSTLLASVINPASRPTPRSNGVEVSDTVEALFTKALAVDPRARFGDVAGFWNALCRAVGLPEVVGDKSPSIAPPPSTSAVPALEIEPALASLGAEPQRRNSSARNAAVRAGPDSRARRDARTDVDGPRSGRTLLDDRLELAEPIHAPEAPGAISSGLSLETGAPPRMFAGRAPVAAAVPVRVASPAQGRARRSSLSMRPLSALRLGGPLRLLGIAVALAVADQIYAAQSGAPLQLGPARVLWVAGPLALAGVVLLILRLFE